MVPGNRCWSFTRTKHGANRLAEYLDKMPAGLPHSRQQEPRAGTHSKKKGPPGRLQAQQAGAFWSQPNIALAAWISITTST